MAAGAILLAAGFLGVGASTSLPWAAVTWVALVGPGYAMLGPHPAMTMLARWFVARRGRMIAIAATGTTFGGILFPPLAQALIDEMGWRWALVGFAAVAAGVGLPVVALGVRASPEEVGARPDGASEPPAASDTAASAVVGTAPAASDIALVRDPRFWLLALGFGVMIGVSIGYVTHLVEWAEESGLARVAAVRVLVVNASFALCGKLVFGWLTDRMGPRRASLVAVALQLAGWAIMLSASSTWPFATGAAIFSLGLGCIIPCQAGFIAAIWGSERFGQAAGLIGLVALFGPFLVPVSLGAAYDRLGDYEWAMRAMWVVVALPGLALGQVRIERAR
jgi:MFS family permease